MNNTRYEMFCINILLLYVPTLVVSVMLVGGFSPPPPPDLPLDQVGRIFSPDNTTMRAGLAAGLFFCCLLAFPMAAIAAQIQRMDGNPILSRVFMLMVAFFIVCGFLPLVMLLAASYRPDIPAYAKIIMIDAAWFMFVGAVFAQVPTNLILGISILGDKNEQRIYPKALGYFNLLMALMFVSGALIPLFRIGPFTYSGSIGFFLTTTCYSVWAWTTYGFTVRAIRRQRAASV